MAVDYQICFPQESIQINSVRTLPGVSPATLDVVGQDFSAVDEVLVNEISAPHFIVVSRTRMMVTLPSSISTIRTVAVTSRKLTMTAKSVLKFKISQVPSKVSGILRLVQLFTKILFTAPGSDIFNKRLGAGGLKNLGRSFSKSQSGGIISEFVVSVENASRQIISMQSRQPGLPQDERLLTAKVSSARFSAQETALLVAVEVTSQAGRSAVANVVV